jgi:hypothetical protein
MGVLVSSSSAAASGSLVNTSASANGTVNPGGVDGRVNPPLVMRELSPAHLPLVELYLNRYLNYLCEYRESFLFLPPFFPYSPGSSSMCPKSSGPDPTTT